MSIRMSYGLQLALALVGGACLDLPNHECTHDTTHMMVGLHHHPDLLPLQGQLTAATSRQNRSSNRRGLSLDSYIGRLSLKGTWKGILEVSAFLVYYITILCSSTSQITRTSQQVWRVHLVYVASGSTSSRHIRRRTDRHVAPRPQADRPTCRATSAGGQTNLSLPDMHQAQPKEGH